MGGASEMRFVGAIPRMLRRCPVESVIVNRSDLLEFSLVCRFITLHHNDEHITSMMSYTSCRQQLCLGRASNVITAFGCFLPIFKRATQLLQSLRAATGKRFD